MMRHSKILRFLPVLALLLLLSVTAQAAVKMEASLLWKYDVRVANEHVFAVDLNGDGIKEVVADAPESGMIYALDSNGEAKWRYSAGTRFYDCYASEPDNQGFFLVVGMFRSANGVDATGKTAWRRPLGYSDSRSAFVSDLNNDNSLESILGTFSGTKSSMEILDSSGQLIEETALRGRQIPYVSTAFDVNGDNKKEILTGGAIFSINTVAENYELIQGKGDFYVYSSEGTLLWSTQEGVYSVAAADLKDDGFGEAVVGTNGQVIAYDYKGDVYWTFKAGDTVKSLFVADVNNDTQLEVIAGAGKKVFLIDSKGGKIWDYTTDTAVTSIDAEDLDGDGTMEIIIGSTTVEVVSSKGTKMWESEALKTVSKVLADDINGDTFIELIAGSTDGFVRVFETAKYAKAQRAILYKNIAEGRFDQRDYEKAKYYADNALMLYEDLKDNKGMTDTRNFLSKVDASIEADGYYNLSLYLFDRGNYANASDYAAKANQLYRNIGTSFGYITQLNVIIDTYRNMSDAKNHYDMAVQLYDSGNYAEASSRALNAKNFYLMLNNTEMILKSDAIYNKSLDHIAGDEYYTQAGLLLEEGNLTASVEYYNMANDVYVRVGDVNGTLNVKEKLDTIGSSEWRKSLRKYGWVAIVLGLILGVVLVVVIASWFIAKTKGTEFKLLLGKDPDKPKEGTSFDKRVGTTLGNR